MHATTFEAQTKVRALLEESITFYLEGLLSFSLAIEYYRLEHLINGAQQDPPTPKKMGDLTITWKC